MIKYSLKKKDDDDSNPALKSSFLSNSDVSSQNFSNSNSLSETSTHLNEATVAAHQHLPHHEKPKLERKPSLSSNNIHNNCNNSEPESSYKFRNSTTAICNNTTTNTITKNNHSEESSENKINKDNNTTNTTTTTTTTNTTNTTTRNSVHKLELCQRLSSQITEMSLRKYEEQSSSSRLSPTRYILSRHFFKWLDPRPQRPRVLSKLTLKLNLRMRTSMLSKIHNEKLFHLNHSSNGKKT